MKYTKRALTVTAILIISAFVRPAHAASITVTTSNDDLTNNGNCTLREAIKAANTDSSVDTCTAGSGSDIIHLNGSTSNEYPLTINGAGENASATGDLDITSTISIVGTGRNDVTIDADAVTPFTDRIFDVTLSGSLTLTDLSVGYADTTVTGAGINDGGSVTLTRVDIYGNTTTVNGAGITVAGSSTLTGTYVNIWGNWAGYTGSNDGGGIYNSGTVTLTKSFLGGNFATRNGGGIYNASVATFTNTAIVDNSAFNGNGGGIRNTGGSTINLDSDTIDSNSSSSAGAGITNNVTGTVNAQRTILSNNIDNSSQSDCNGTFNSQDYNLIEVTTGCTLQGTTTHNITGSDPNLAAGWYTTSTGVLYDALMYGSPAIDASGASCQSVDVADTSRPQRGTHGPSALCDMGNFEYIIDETAPTVSATVNVAGATSNKTPTVTVTSDEPGNLSFSCSQGTTWTSAVTFVNPEPADAQLNTLSDGTYFCVARVTDTAQNVGQSGVMSFRIDTSAPVVTLVTAVPNPTNNPIATIRVSENASLTFSGCTTDASAATEGVNLTLTLSGIAEGRNKNCSVTARDAANNPSFPLSMGSFTYDVTPPVISPVGYYNRVMQIGGYFDDGAQVGDNLAGLAGGQLTIKGTPLNNGVYPNDGKHYGTYQILYTATDLAGNDAVPYYRPVTFAPTVDTIGVKNKKTFTITKLNKSTLTITPFGSKNTVDFAVRKITFSKNTQFVYAAFMVGPTKSWSANLYDQNGKLINILYNSKAKRISSLTLPSSMTTKGVNWAYAFDAPSNQMDFAFTSKNGTDSPQILSITPYGGSWQALYPKKKTSSGNVLATFATIDGDVQALVTSTNNHVRIWNGGAGYFQENTTFNPGSFYVSNGVIKKNYPTLKYVYSSGAGSLYDGTTIHGNYTLAVGSDASTKTTMRVQLGAFDQTLDDGVSSNQHTYTVSDLASGGYYLATFKACNPSKSSAIGCVTTRPYVLIPEPLPSP